MDQTRPTSQTSQNYPDQTTPPSHSHYHPESTTNSNPPATHVNHSHEQTPVKSHAQGPNGQSLPSQHPPQPSPNTYDKRMPPPSLDWRTQSGVPAKQSSPTRSSSQPNTSSPSSANRKRVNEEPETSSPPKKKRVLNSSYVPAAHTSWKPDWLETTQSYPVNANGEELSNVEQLMGDIIYERADKLKQLLEDEYMYIPSHNVDRLLALAQDTYERLKTTKAFLDNYSLGPIRVERNRYA
jgi:hypothetical protein